MTDKNSAKLQASIVIDDSMPHQDLLNVLTALSPEDVELKVLDVAVIDIVTNPELLSSNIAAIFLSETGNSDNLSGFNIAEAISAIRSTVPIFMRVDCEEKYSDILFRSKAKMSGISSLYYLENQKEVKSVLHKFIFGNHYPRVFVNDIQKIGSRVFGEYFEGFSVESTIPYVIYDFTLSNMITAIVPFTSAIGTGFFSIQTHEGKFAHAVQSTFDASGNQDDAHFYEGVIGELSNLVLGKFKYAVSCIPENTNKNTSTIPIVLNPNRNMISFGRHKPQLCFRYVLTKVNEPQFAFTLHMKVISNFLYDSSELPQFSQFIDQHGDIAGEVEFF